MDFQMSSLGQALQAVAVLRSEGYDDVAMERRRVGGDILMVVTVSPNDELGVYSAERPVLALDPDTQRLS